MNIKHKSFPFGIKAETKTSKAGKEYLSIGVSQSSKDMQGNWDNSWFNMIDKRDLLVLANACNQAYNDIVEAENEAYDSNTPVKTPSNAVDDAPFNDDVPF